MKWSYEKEPILYIYFVINFIESVSIRNTFPLKIATTRSSLRIKCQIYDDSTWNVCMGYCTIAMCKSRFRESFCPFCSQRFSMYRHIISTNWTVNNSVHSYRISPFISHRMINAISRRNLKKKPNSWAPFHWSFQYRYVTNTIYSKNATAKYHEKWQLCKRHRSFITFQYVTKRETKKSINEISVLFRLRI